ncbi:MAG: SPOR domain-containing protein [Steroidobacteraceae bacterium]|nr:SPOR domain-containing protein [Steroidobacteraceae bacterium]
MSTRALVTLFAIPLLALTTCSRESSDWRSALAADTAVSYAQFIVAHPDSTRIASARERLSQLAEEKDWRSAAETDTLEAYQRFVDQYPAGRWAKEARTRVENFASGAAAASVGLPGSATPAAAATGEDPPQAGSAEPEAAPATPDSASGFGIQLGAFSTAERANDEWKKLQADANGMLDGLSPRVVVGDVGGKTIYRLQAEVRDEAQARAICGGLKVAKRPCVPVLPAPAP